ncbi:MAG: NAD(P)-binding protein, partial [Clostridia bacterium]|nr:NAD(P)-binding protein [Clostridia bacterium]
MKYDYLIVGSGLFGAVFARKALDAGKTCLIIERRSHIGGNVYTEEVDGVIVHKYGAHIFHTSDEEVWSFITEYAEFNDYINSPIADYHGERYHLPFNMNTFHEMWGVNTAEEARKIIDEQVAKANIKEPKNLEEQAISMVGEDVYRKLVKEYTEKQWGRDCKDLPPFI